MHTFEVIECEDCPADETHNIRLFRHPGTSHLNINTFDACGWYWTTHGFEEPSGPFATEAEAIADAGDA